jgi:hypothetical protein
MSPAGRWLACIAIVFATRAAQGAEEAASSTVVSPPVVRETLEQATRYFHQRVSRHGGYVYHVSVDGRVRWGEGRVGADTIVVQPPGTPAVGLAYLVAWRATGDDVHRAAALDAARALVAGQLESGGWTQTIDFPPYAAGAKRLGRYRRKPAGDWNSSSLDDGQSTTALRFLLRLDRELKASDPAIHEAAEYGLKSLCDAQFPNGAFPQVFTGPVLKGPWADLRLDDPALREMRARYPEQTAIDAPRVKNYWDCYTLNDDLAGAVLETFVEAEAWERTSNVATERLVARRAIERLGKFLLAARMPEPQPAWCQQYHPDMIPVWARKFEPPAIACSESEDVARTLIRIARHTGDATYLQGLERSLEYLGTCLLPDGRYARYRELRTNRPLYMDAEYRLAYDDSSAPSHYGWKRDAHLSALRAELVETRRDLARRVGTKPNEAFVAETKAPRGGPTRASLERMSKLLKEFRRLPTGEGCWVSKYAGESLMGQAKFAAGTEYLSSGVFCKNIEALAEYLTEAARREIDKSP